MTCWRILPRIFAAMVFLVTLGGQALGCMMPSPVPYVFEATFLARLPIQAQQFPIVARVEVLAFDAIPRSGQSQRRYARVRVVEGIRGVQEGDIFYVPEYTDVRPVVQDPCNLRQRISIFESPVGAIGYIAGRQTGRVPGAERDNPIIEGDVPVCGTAMECVDSPRLGVRMPRAERAEYCANNPNACPVWRDSTGPIIYRPRPTSPQ